VRGYRQPWEGATVALRWKRASRLAGRSVAVVLVAVLGVAWVVEPAEATGPIGSSRFLVSVDNAGVLGNGSSASGVLNEDGRFLVFRSVASNLVPGDTNGHSDVFVKDRTTGVVHRVSVSSTGVQGNRATIGRPSISADGRYVAFSSAATNLVPNDLNNREDVFVRDLMTNTTVRVSVSTGGAEANGVSGEAAISGDGRVVAFSTKANNLVPGDTNGRADILVRDWSAASPTTAAVSVSTGGVPGNDGSYDPSLSRNGRLIAFTSFATDLVVGDTNGRSDIFVRDTAAATTTMVSTSHTGGPSDGDSAGAQISIDGDAVVYDSYATNLVSRDTNNHRDVFMRSVASATTTLESRYSSPNSNGHQGNGDSFEPIVGGGTVAFSTNATNLTSTSDTNGLTDVIVSSTATHVVSAARTNGTPVGGTAPAISADGQQLVFTSASSGITPNDTNGATDLFMPQYATQYCEGTGSGQIECALNVVPEPTTVRWSIDGTYQPALDNLTIVGAPVNCQPASRITVTAVVVGGGGIAELRAGHYCEP
jgi:Tol biopolymer transport system component